MAWSLLYEYNQFSKDLALVADIHFPEASLVPHANCLEMDTVHMSGTVTVDVRNTFYITSKANSPVDSYDALVQTHPSGAFWNKVFIDLDMIENKENKVFIVLTIRDESMEHDMLLFALDNIKLHSESCDIIQG